MKNISKANQNSFISKMKIELSNIGAVPLVSERMEYHLQTKHGILWLRIDENQKVCYTVFGRFIDTEKAPKMDGVNSWSGKFNQHLSPSITSKEAVSLIISQYKNLLN